MELTPFLLILVAVVGWGVGDVFARKALFGARAETVLAVIVAVVALSVGNSRPGVRGRGGLLARRLPLSRADRLDGHTFVGQRRPAPVPRASPGWRRHRLSTPRHGAASRHRNGCPARRGAAQRGDARRRGARGRGRWVSWSQTAGGCCVERGAASRAVGQPGSRRYPAGAAGCRVVRPRPGSLPTNWSTRGRPDWSSASTKRYSA